MKRKWTDPGPHYILMWVITVILCGGFIGCGAVQENSSHDSETRDGASTGKTGRDTASQNDTFGGNEDETAQDKLEVLSIFTEQCTGDISKTDQGIEIIEDEATFRQALAVTKWENIPQDEQELPEIDFERHIVVGAYAGHQTQCGGKYFISDAVDRGEYVEITVTTVHCAVGDDAETWPYTFAQIPRLDKRYVFIEETVEEEC